MDKPTEVMFNDLLSTAKILVDTPNNINWDLAHYIADYAIGKIMMLKLADDKEYSNNKVENYGFPELVEEFQTQFSSIKLNYEEIKEQHKQGRNSFQHKLITTYLGIRQPHAKFYVETLHLLMDQIKILNPTPNYSITPKENIPKYPLNPKNEIEFFIERLTAKDYKSVMDRFYDDEFEKIFTKLFTKIKKETGHLRLLSNSFNFAIGVGKVFDITPLFEMEEKYKVSWDNISTLERVQIFLVDFKDRVKLIYGFNFKEE